LEDNNTYEETDLLRRVAKGEHEAFGKLLKKYHVLAFNTAKKLSNDSWMAEDVVQEVFLKVWLKRTELPTLSSFKAWLITVTTHAIYDNLRKKTVENKHLSSLVRELLPFETFPLQVSESSIIHEELIAAAMERLSPKQKDAFRLIKKEGYTREETASLMNISPETVKTHLEQAMRTVRAYCLSRLDKNVVLMILLVIKQKYF
jgi:RNA polymerase sigma factor (sigma-70 family)